MERSAKINWLERKDADFPYYDGEPAPISGSGWIVVVIGVAIGFFALGYGLSYFQTGIAGFIPGILFCGIPLAALAYASGGQWTAIFRKLRPIDILIIVAFFVMNWIVTIAVGTLVVSLFETTTNPSGETIAQASAIEKFLFFPKTAIQLLGEEIFTILPFLAIFAWLVKGAGISRGLAISLAALAVAVVFALVHLPTYDWNFGQALVGLVPIRIVLLLPFIITKNIWVSTAVHIANDWTIFGLPLLVAAGAS